MELKLLTSTVMLSFDSWWASTITHTTLTTSMGQDDSPEYKIIGTKRDRSKQHTLQNAQGRVIEQSLAENICSVVH